MWLQVAGRVVVSLWALAVLRRYDHPLAALLLRAVGGLSEIHAARLGPVGRKQLSQFMLLSAADSRMAAVMAVPAAVRNLCVVECKRAPPPPEDCSAGI